MAALSAVAGRGMGRTARLQVVARGCRQRRRARTAFMDSHDSRRSCLASLLSLYGRRGGLQRPSPTLCTCVLLLLLVLLAGNTTDGIKAAA